MGNYFKYVFASSESYSDLPRLIFFSSSTVVFMRRMLKYTDKNVAVQKDLIRAHEEKNNGKMKSNYNINKL